MKVQKGNPELSSQCEVILETTIPNSFLTSFNVRKRKNSYGLPFTSENFT